MNIITGLKISRNELGIKMEDSTLDTENILSSIRTELNIDNPFDIPFVSKALAERKIDVIIDDEGRLKGYERATAIIVHDEQMIDMLYGDILFYGVNGMGDTIELTKKQTDYILNNLFVGALVNKDTEEEYQVAIIPHQ